MQESEHISAARDDARGILRVKRARRRAWSAASLLGLVLACCAALLGPAPASAQDPGNPDMRGILPYLMLVVDTSGSMEYTTGCSCTTRGCLECMPKCSLPNDPVTHVPPKSPAPNSHELKKSRWSTTLEALTGSINDFQCSTLPRTIPTYDFGFPVPYHQPWHCANQAADTACAFDDTTTGNSTFSQTANGVLDSFSSSVFFGLMTFDGMDTYLGAEPLVASTAFDVTRSEDEAGLWSYGGARAFHYRGCDHDYMMDTGARSPIATEGALISLNSCTGARGTSACQPWCTLCPATQDSINADIQSALIRTRPYGGTPIAAALDDLYHHLRDDQAGDRYANCRDHYALLITDGLPDDDYRDVGCDCQHETPVCTGADFANSKCPYPLATTVASDLINGRTGDKAMLKRLFVVGLAVGDDARVVSGLDDIAKKGCPNVAGCRQVGDTHDALFASDPDNLIAQVTNVLQSTIKPISRSVPAFAVGGNALSTNLGQYQISAGFRVATKTGDPWTGVLERKRFTCATGQTSPTENDINRSVGADDFEVTLNAQSTRTLLTPNVADTVNSDGALASGSSGDGCATGCALVDLGGVNPNKFGLAPTDITGRGKLMDWMLGNSGSVRFGKRLGDIYHSTPVIMSAPRFDTSDETFNQFRLLPHLATRPLTAFVGSNDGILHAFAVEDATATDGGGSTFSVHPGDEIWGFIPPLVVNDIALYPNSHQFSMDGTPIIKNVYFNKPLTGGPAAATAYHTVLITGMRDGGSAYIALDVTDIKNPHFLWQFTDTQMGRTFAQAAVGQATFLDYSGGGAGVPKNGAVAILPGGVGQIGTASDCDTTHPAHAMQPDSGPPFASLVAPTTTGGTAATFPHRSDLPCWQDKGRALYFIDVENGHLIKKIHDDINGKPMFPAPFVGTPAIFESDIGTTATRAFLMDADGVMWRVDLTPEPGGLYQDASPTAPLHPRTGWTARPFHDVFGNVQNPLTDYDLTYEAPIMSTDTSGHVVLITGTGDNNNFTKDTVMNRVVSLTEIQNPNTTHTVLGAEDWKAQINWEMRVNTDPTHGLVQSEMVTGSMGLSNGQLFLATFIAVPASSDACDYGKGRIHAVDYLLPDITDTNDGTPTTYGPRRIPLAELGISTSDPAATVINTTATGAVPNLMVMGLGVTERPSCQTVDSSNFDVWSQSTFGSGTYTPPSIYLVANASGQSGTNSLVQNRKGSALGSVQLQMKKKASISKVTSWATSVD